VTLGNARSGRPSIVCRALVGIAFAAIAGTVAFRAQYVIHAHGGDHIVLWRAAHIILEGGDPYQIAHWSGGIQLPDAKQRFFYPLPAFAFGLPFAWLSPEAAAVAFVVCSAAALGYLLTRDGYERVPLILSVPFLASAQFAQTTVAIVACALEANASGFALLKPNIGLALFAWRPSRRAALVASAIFIGSAILSPTWPAHWRILVRSSPTHHAPITMATGFVALAAIARWRRPEARLLIAMSLIPHGLYFYDELPLLLIASSRRETMVLTFMSWLGLLAWMATSPGPDLHHIQQWVVASLYPATVIMILRRPNEGHAPKSIDGLLLRAPAWLRGRPPAA